MTDARRGLTLIELLVVMFIMAILMAYIAVVLMNIGSEPRKRKAMADMAKLELALSAYEGKFGTYPPDTGYGLRMEGDRPVYARKARGIMVDVPTYDPGSLWRYLYKQVKDPKTGRMVGPFLDEWPQSQLKSYNDVFNPAGAPPSRYLIDPWGNPYGFVGDKRRVVHNHGAYDLFSAGPDGFTACNNNIDDKLMGKKTGDAYTDCSDDPQSALEVDNRAYNSRQSAGVWSEIDDDGSGVPNDSQEFGPEAILNGDEGDDVNNWTAH